MRILYVLGVLFLCMSVSAQVIYKTMKADGSTVYSDVSHDGAVPVKLSSVNSVVVPALNNAVKQTVNRDKSVKIVRSEVEYLVLINSPEPEQTLRDNSGAVSISAEVLPKRAGKFQLLFDNQVVKTQKKGAFYLENVNRGAHIIQVYFLDNSGKILALSKPQTFYLQKSSALINAN